MPPPCYEARSDASAKKDGLQTLPGEILRPRTKGLALLLGESSKGGGGAAAGGGYFDRVVDMTVAYTDKEGKPLKGSALGEEDRGGEHAVEYARRRGDRELSLSLPRFSSFFFFPWRPNGFYGNYS